MLESVALVDVDPSELADDAMGSGSSKQPKRAHATADPSTRLTAAG
jgi:hypothetical protein